MYTYEINDLSDDLEKKLELYSNSYDNHALNYCFEQEKYIKIAEVIININDEEIQDMIDKLHDDYQNGIQYTDNKFDIRNEHAHVCSQLYKQLYYIDKNIAFNSYLDIVQRKLHGDLDWFFDIKFDTDSIRNHFLNNATEYIVQNNNKLWTEEFKKINYERYSFLKRIELNKIPEIFETKEELFLWLKYNEQAEILDFIGLPILNSLLRVIIRHDVYNIHSHSFTQNRIIRILEECKDDYILVGQILTNKNIKLNIFLLKFFKYSIFGLLNLYELDSSPHNLQSKNMDYTNEWNNMISKQMIDIFFLHFSNLQDKDNFSDIVFNVLNYIAKDYILHLNKQYVTNKKQFLFKVFMEKLSSHEITKGDHEKGFLIEFILDDLVNKQITQFSLEELNLNDYYLLSSYLSQILKLKKILDIDYDKLIEKITNSVLYNLENIVTSNLNDDKLYIKYEVLEKIDFSLFYELSEDKNRWFELVDIEQVKNIWLELENKKSNQKVLSSEDPREPKNIIKLYFYTLLQIFEKNKDNKIAQRLNKIAIEFGLKIDFGIFHEYSWMGHQFTEKLFLRYVNILNMFEDKLYNHFLDELYSQDKLRDILELLNYTENRSRKKRVIEKINSYIENGKLEFSSYFDIRESILYAQFNDLNELSTKLIEKYSDKINKDNYNNNYKEFLLIVCQKELLDIVNNEKMSLDDKFNNFHQYKNPFDDKNHGVESKEIKCENYKDFIRGILFFETEPIKTYKILSELIDKELNSIYLINMLNAYFKAYENDEHKEEKFNYIMMKYEEYDKRFNRKHKSLYEYQVLFYGYTVVNNTDKLEKIYKETPDHYSEHIEEYLPNEIKLFDKVVNLKKKLVVCVEGEFDINFIKNINQSIPEYRNIIDLKKLDISIIPLGGSNLQKWVKENHLEGSNIVELHIYDSDVGASSRNENKYLKECEEIKSRKDNSNCFLTNKREMENYIHQNLIETEFNIDMSSIPDWDKEDIPKFILNKIDDGKNEKTVKSILNGRLSKKMTKELLEELNAFDEISTWFEKMVELSKV